jgi:glutamine phosphoribosylpyrophosphate amidotransferase
VGCDSLAFLDLEELVKAIGLPSKDLCLGCFTGHYPEEVRTR